MQVKKAGQQVDFRALDKAQKHNEDGYGCAWYEDGFVKTYKTFNYNQFKGVVAALKGHSMVVHLRYATRGGKTFNNIHPFDIPSGVMFHNGTMAGLGNYKKSDSQELAETISKCDYKFIEDITPLIKPYIDDKINRLVFFEDNGQITIMNKSLGIEDESGLWHSNDYHLKDEGWCRSGYCKPKVTVVPTKKVKTYVAEKKHKVFVYGTLKRGYGNHRLLEKATLLGKAKTVKKWTMIGANKAFPYVMEQHDVIGNNIIGEVYHISDGELASLNILEGVPHHYISQQAKIMYTDDFTMDDVMIYTKTYVPPNYQTSETLITEWRAADAV